MASKMKKLFGFDWEEVSSWQRLVKLLNRPEDPSSLAVFRILFGTSFLFYFFHHQYVSSYISITTQGLVMMIDIPNERGMSQADSEYGSKTTCHFPLFDSLKPLPPEWMVLVYAVMFIGWLIELSAFFFIYKR
jgi:vitamin K-dependent gamma-carboxylase